MSARGKDLFERFIAKRAAHPDLRNAPPESQFADLRDAAEAEDVTLAEIVEEVGELPDAIARAIREGYQGIR
ncbi:MAG: hypothetical protein WAK03_09680 [Methylocystis sp.]